MSFVELSRRLDSGGALTVTIFDRQPSVLKLATWAVVITTIFIPRIGRAATTYPLQTKATKGATSTVQAVFEVDGHLKLNADGKQVTKVPFQVRANLKYDERLLAAPSSPKSVRVARFYHDAKANLKIGDADFPSELNRAKRLIVAERSENATSMYSPGRHLTREELDLIDVQGNTSQLQGLLPGKPVVVGDSWNLSDDFLAAILDLDTVVKSEVLANLKEIEGELAIIELSGTVSGAVGGISSDIEIQGKCNFHLKHNLIVWFALHLKEDRAIGHAEPGYQVEAKIRLAIAPRESSIELSDTVVAGLPQKSDAGARMLEFSAEKGGFHLMHETGWHVMADRHDVTILRLVQRGDLIAQCNISNLPAVEKTEPLALGEFQKEVQQSLGKNFGQIAEATESRTSTGLRVLRVVATGVASELPIEWIYYHASNTTGRRAAFVFTLESKLAEPFGATDQTMVETFQFSKLPEPKTAREPKRDAKSKR